MNRAARNPMLIAGLLVGLALVACARGLPAPAGAAELSVAGEANALPDTLRLEPYMGRLRQLPVTFPGANAGEAAPPPFLFDTGGGLTLITPEVAGAIGCEPYGSMTGFRHNGDRIDCSKCDAVRMLVGDHAAQPLLGVFDLGALLPPELPPLGGVLSLHTFRGERVTMYLGRNMLVIESEASFAARIRPMRELHARLETEASGEGIDLFVEIAAPRGTLWLMVDSGNLVNVLLAPHALRQLGFDAWADAPDDSLTGGAREVTLDLLGYGPLTVSAQAMPGLIHDGMLDARTLERLVLSMDLATGRTWAAPATE